MTVHSGFFLSSLASFLYKTPWGIAGLSIIDINRKRPVLISIRRLKYVFHCCITNDLSLVTTILVDAVVGVLSVQGCRATAEAGLLLLEASTITSIRDLSKLLCPVKR